MAAAEAELLADQLKDGFNERRLLSLVRAGGRTSKAEARRQAAGKKRQIRVYDTNHDTTVLSIEGDSTDIAEMMDGLQSAANHAYHQAGGRETSLDDHVPWAHRLFDAAQQLLTNSSPATGAAGGGRATIFINTALNPPNNSNRSDTSDDVPLPEWIGHGPIPDTFLEYLGCNANFHAQVFGVDGEAPWQGRRQRLATPAIMRGLISRDGGCVLCRANPNMCEAHHLVPWNSPKRGGTNIDEMALVCGACHRRLHDDEQTRYHGPGPPDPNGNPTRIWKLRPATPSETPPPRQ